MSSYVTNAVDFYDKLTDLIRNQSEWSQSTFGSDQERGPIGPLRHLEKEAKEAYEAIEDGSDVEVELADCLLLLLDATRRSGRNLLDIVNAASIKMEVNKRRKWPTFKSGDCSPVEHLKE